MSLLPDNIHPSKFYNQVGITILVGEQIKKDFNIHYFEFDFQDNSAINFCDAIIQQIEPLVKKQLINNPEKFFSKLYRLDLSASIIKKFIHAGPNKHNLKELSTLIVKRAFEKVVFREWHAGRL